MTPPPDLRAARAVWNGFTLLEVMAAVAILGLWYVVIAHSSVLGLHTEGENLRRLEAAAIADFHLAELESGLRSGVVPENRNEESEEGDYRVQVEIGPFSLDSETGQGSQPTPDLIGGTVPDLRALLDSEMPLMVERLRALHVTVGWLEADGPRVVSRTSFLLDCSTCVEEIEEAVRRTSGRGQAGPVDRTR